MSTRFLHCGDTALVVQLGDVIDRDLNAKVLGLQEDIRAQSIPGVLETVPTFRSITVHYDPLKISAAELQRSVETLVHAENEAKQTRTLWRIPACYEPNLAPDLASVAEHTGLSRAEVIELHTSTRYYIYMIGFVPGYPYMGDLPAPLVLPRREDPRLRVRPGSIGIATSMTAIYPLESPAGWYLIGTTPIRIFETRRLRPALFTPGDCVEFYSVTESEYDRIRTASEAGRHEVQREGLSP